MDDEELYQCPICGAVGDPLLDKPCGAMCPICEHPASVLIPYKKQELDDKPPRSYSDLRND